MSTTETDHTVAEERPYIVREYETVITRGDGRTIDVRVVPYGEVIEHNDGHGGVPAGVTYRETFEYGAFSEQVAAKGRERHVLLNFEHHKGIGGIIGHGLAFIEREDGLYGSFRVHENPDGDKALMLVAEDILTTVSLEAKNKRSVKSSDGVVKRVAAHLYQVALTRFGAYKGAVVLALREEPEFVIDEKLLPVPMDPELLARCERLGIAVPEHLKAHPESGTPSGEGTPADGTRPNNDPTTEKE